MKEYIERVTALNALIRALGYCQCANDVITRIPAADVAEVRRGTKQCLPQWRGPKEGKEDA